MTAYTPNLPALISVLHDDATRAPQTEFTRARQVLFLENLSVTGSVRSAAAAGGVSHQTAYRARRGTPAFRLAWDAALVAARANAESVLACRAIDGVEEKVFYHGEEVATRTRYSDRLLLAHLARLDRHAADARINAVAEDFDAALARFEAGEEIEVSAVGDPSTEVPASAGTRDGARSPAQAGVSCGHSRPHENLSPGPCNTRSMSYTSGPTADGDEDWDDDDLDEAMEEARPLDAPDYEAFADPVDAQRCQRAMFESGEDEWWTCGEDFIPYMPDGTGGWMPDPEELAYRAALPAPFASVAAGEDLSAAHR